MKRVLSVIAATTLLASASDLDINKYMNEYIQIENVSNQSDQKLKDDIKSLSGSLFLELNAFNPLSINERQGLQALNKNIKGFKEVAKNKGDDDMYYVALALQNIITIALNDDLVALFSDSIEINNFDIVEYGKGIQEADKDLCVLVS